MWKVKLELISHCTDGSKRNFLTQGKCWDRNVIFPGGNSRGLSLQENRDGWDGILTLDPISSGTCKGNSGAPQE